MEYGGSASTRSYFLPAPASCPSPVTASWRTTLAPLKPSLSRLRSIARTASGSDSTKTAAWAPRESASRPFAPRRDDVEDVLAHAVRGRARFEPLGCLDGVTLARAGNDPHPRECRAGAAPRRPAPGAVLRAERLARLEQGLQAAEDVH